MTITGYPGAASVVMEADLPININQHSVRFGLRDGWPAGYVAAAINSPFGKVQVDRLSIGGTREALDYPSVRSLKIPTFDSATRRRIGQQVIQANTACRISERLTAAAKCLVEGLIDQRVTESDLTAAQSRLEQGDLNGDRDVLSRLYEGGIDATDTKPLFPDLDAYYETLELARASNKHGGAE